jgi:anti-sigma B factor antagonist
MVLPGSNWSDQLHVTRLDLDCAVCLALTGELDLASAPVLTNHLKSAAETEKHLVVDLSGLRYIDSTGAKVLLEAHRNLKQRGRRIVLAAVSPMARRILTVLGVEQVLAVYPTVDDAVAALSP